MKTENPSACVTLNYKVCRNQPVARQLPKHRTTQTQNKRLHTPNIYVLIGTRIHDPSVRANEDSSCLRPRGYCDRRVNV
jgi:hypothetical protein